tara:strand:- start:3351 stop:3782 length:432 start_codon:yes stop_codon:yes gene_type:complete
MSEEFEVDKIAKKKNKELERAMKLRSNEDLIDSVNRISAIEFEQENPVKVKIKKKPKPDKKTINPGRAGKGNFNVGGSVKEDKGFPDFSGDGQITQKDILMGKGVIPKVKDMKMGGPVKANKKTSFRGQYDIQTKKVKFKGIF